MTAVRTRQSTTFQQLRVEQALILRSKGGIMDAVKEDKADKKTSHRFEYGTGVVPAECIYELSKDEQETIRTVVAGLPSPTISSIDSNDFFTQVALASDDLPRGIRKRLTEFLYHSNEFGTLLFRGLPETQTLPLTPSDGRAFSDKLLSITEYNLLLLMVRLGDPRGYIDEKIGAIIQNIYPVPGAEYRQENTSSLEFLELHTEDGFLGDRCDFLALSCLRSDHERVAKTGTASVQRAMKLVSGTVVEWLRKPLYRISVPSSFMSEQDLWSRPMPIISGDFYSPEMCIDLDAMEGMTALAQKALNSFATALKASLVSCALVPGDLLIIDNLVAAHARSVFRARYDGQDRWLQRLKVVINARASQKYRQAGSRVCESVGFELFTDDLLSIKL